MDGAEAAGEELVRRFEREELHLSEMQRRYVGRSAHVRDLLDSPCQGCSSGAIFLWDADEAMPPGYFDVDQQQGPRPTTCLPLDGQDWLASLSPVIRGTPLSVRGRRRRVEFLLNLRHPNDLPLTKVDEADDGDGKDDDEDIADHEAALSRARADAAFRPRRRTSQSRDGAGVRPTRGPAIRCRKRAR